LEYINDIFRDRINHSEYIVTKSIKDSENVTDDGAKLGDYKIKILPTDPNERTKALRGLTEREYMIKSCPAHVQLAERMKKRGCPIDVGSRMEYVALNKPHARTLGDQIEDYDYFAKRKAYFKLDKLYYLQSLVNPIDELLNVGIGISKFVETQYKYRSAHKKLVIQLNKHFSAKLIISIYDK
jgi:DNA polymerase elongation subunit (family B)